MGAHQRKLWEDMIRVTEDYLGDRIELKDLVGRLEGLLDAAELKDEVLTREFLEHWMPLETEHACRLELGTPPDEEALQRRVEAMRAFLHRTCDRAEACDPGRF